MLFFLVFVQDLQTLSPNSALPSCSDTPVRVFFLFRPTGRKHRPPPPPPIQSFGEAMSDPLPHRTSDLPYPHSFVQFLSLVSPHLWPRHPSPSFGTGGGWGAAAGQPASPLPRCPAPSSPSVPSTASSFSRTVPPSRPSSSTRVGPRSPRKAQSLTSQISWFYFHITTFSDEMLENAHRTL